MCFMPLSLLFCSLLLALGVGSMTLSVASLVTIMSVLSFVNTSSSSTHNMALFHAVDMWPLRFWKVSIRRFSPFCLSMSSSAELTRPSLWLVFPGFVWMGLQPSSLLW